MFTDAVLPIVATTFFLAGLSALLILLLRILAELKIDPRGNRRIWQVASWRVDMKRALAIVMAIGLIGCASITSWVNRELRLYSPVIPGIPLGTITVMQERGMLPRLVYSSIDKEGREALEVFPVRDATYRMKGERIRWAPQLHFLGLDEHFKISQIEFYPSDGADAGRLTFSVDVRRGSTVLYQRLVQFHDWLPFVEVDSIQTDAWSADLNYSRNLYLFSNKIVSR
jgi:hypothetical protein